jgi:hypothetical protein
MRRILMSFIKRENVTRWLTVGAVAMLALPTLASTPASAQGDQRTFPETGKTVRGQFLSYWFNNGGLEQQGFPISEEMQERSDTDGKTYTVQYFERSVFELHPELNSVNKVLLQLLGVFLYNQKYPGGAPGQTPNSQPGSVAFPQTGKRVGGTFLAYWQNHGGLAQQGYPISDEFSEVSLLDGKTYRVQYFERAVFEFHPENAGTKYEVLLSQLGKFRYDAKRGGGNPNPPPPPPPSQPTPAPPSGRQSPCGPLPENVRAVTDVTTVRAGQSIRLAAGGFTVTEPVSYWFTAPTGDVIGTASPVDLEVGSDGIIGPFEIQIPPQLAALPGIWALTFQGAYSQNTAVVYFCITQ